ncbi:MAG TPA: hypothetical protein PK802_04955 [Candidatus Cloacimonadota bacterium]|nr:hypothetical protein [Candidatus Cloacimonadota bacterium]HQP18000.1 hypothetical protein [Candidatus Cloacimonadota bacterium]
MPNLFKIDFVMGKTDAPDYNQVKHSLEDSSSNRAIISLSVSADKLQSVSNYSREPKRLVFECFPTVWIQENILSGENEHERYISHFEVKVYRDEALFFTGIIDTSQLSFDVASGILKISCYDKIKLLSLFSDLTHYYSLSAGYLPQWILAYFMQDIGQKIPVNIPYSSQFSLPTLNIGSGNALTIAHIGFDDLLAFPNPTHGWTYSYDGSGWPGPQWGYLIDTIANRMSFVFAYKKVIKATYPSPATTRYQGRYRGRVYKFFNNICPVVVEYDEKTDWVENLASLENATNEFIGFFTGNGISESTLYNGLVSVGSIDGRSYGSSQYVNHWIEAHFHGNLFPAKLHPGKAYVNYTDEQTDNIKVLQAMLMLYNATTFSNPQGQIVFKNKDAYSSTVIDIDADDVVDFVTKRGNPEKPQISSLDILTGDTSQLQNLIKDYLIDFHDSKWSCEATIDSLSKYNLTLQSRIRIQNQIYAITELERNYIEDEYRVKAWLL